MKYFIVDVFCINKYSGNQLAVVICDSNLSKEQMLAIANEFHFSETTFIMPDQLSGNMFKVKIFTPVEEVPFAGHPTLGSAFIIRNEIIKQPLQNIILDLNVGKIPVYFDDADAIQWMHQIEPAFGAMHDPENAARLVNVSIDSIDTRFPVQNVTTGIEFMLIPLKSLDAIRSASTNLNFYKEYFSSSAPLPLFLFCPQTYERSNSINCRMFADVFGIPEDPATGSANGCLAAFLSKYRYFGSSSVEIKVEQGYEIGRRSLLYLKSDFKNNRYAIQVGGNVIKVAEGFLV